MKYSFLSTFAGQFETGWSTIILFGGTQKDTTIFRLIFGIYFQNAFRKYRLMPVLLVQTETVQRAGEDVLTVITKLLNLLIVTSKIT